MARRKSKEPQAKLVKGKQLTCPICGNKYFLEREAQLNTAGMSLLDLDFLNKSATCYVCSDCTHIMWFMEK